MNIKYLHEFLVELRALDASVQKQLVKKLDELHRASPEGYPHEALKGERFKGLFKFRVNDYRLIYKLTGSEVLFVTLGHRSEVYE